MSEKWTVDRAVVVLAEGLAASSIEDGPEWEDVPDIGEYDWQLVEAALRRIAGRVAPDPDEYEQAYRFLEGRAEHDVDV